MIALAYWLFYALPLFWEPHTISDIYTPARIEISDAGVTMAMLMAVLGVGSLWLRLDPGVGRVSPPPLVSTNLGASPRPFISLVFPFRLLLHLFYSLPSLT